MTDLAVAPVSLGEGWTPLIAVEINDRRAFLKCEVDNPTGSFKDRGMSALTAVVRSRAVEEVVEDSSGNAGASLAAYAARAGVSTKIFVPEGASGPKCEQVRAYGAEMIRVPGSRQAASNAALAAAAGGAAYASHAYSPFCLAGYATCAYEIFAQLGEGPAAVVLPVGQGGLLLGLDLGFRSLRRAGMIGRGPALIGVQASACAPFCHDGNATVRRAAETIAEGIRIEAPIRIAAVTDAVRRSRGRFVAVEEDDIRKGRDRLAQMGFYVEATSAVVWEALSEILEEYGDPLVAVLTGTGLKGRLGGI